MSIAKLKQALPAPIKNILRPIYHFLLSSGRCILRCFLSLVRLLIGKQAFLKLSHVVTEVANINVIVDGISFYVTGPIPLRRAETLLTKEPDTILWLQNYIKENDIFYDVGANVGVFSLYSAIKCKAKVIAFEPMCANFELLNRNIYINKLSESITALNVALNDCSIVAKLNVSSFLPGKAGHGFNNDLLSPTSTIVEPDFKQGVLGLSMDDFIELFSQPFPNHIKIDVDGNEPKILKGMEKTLQDRRLKSIAIELDTENREQDAHVIEVLKAAGFEELEDKAFFNTTSISWTHVRNHFFVRS
jgi:FkbM family methyltransferase